MVKERITWGEHWISETWINILDSLQLGSVSSNKWNNLSDSVCCQLPYVGFPQSRPGDRGWGTNVYLRRAPRKHEQGEGEWVRRGKEAGYWEGGKQVCRCRHLGLDPAGDSWEMGQHLTQSCTLRGERKQKHLSTSSCTLVAEGCCRAC